MDQEWQCWENWILNLMSYLGWSSLVLIIIIIYTNNTLFDAWVNNWLVWDDVDLLYNKTPRGVSVGCIGLRIASQGQDEWQIEQSQQTSMISQEDWEKKKISV